MMICPHCQADLRHVVPAPARCPACGGLLPTDLGSHVGTPQKLTTPDIGATVELPFRICGGADAAPDSSQSDASKAKDEKRPWRMRIAGLISQTTVDFSTPGVGMHGATASGFGSDRAAIQSRKEDGSK